MLSVNFEKLFHTSPQACDNLTNSEFTGVRLSVEASTPLMHLFKLEAKLHSANPAVSCLHSVLCLNMAGLSEEDEWGAAEQADINEQEPSSPSRKTKMRATSAQPAGSPQRSKLGVKKDRKQKEKAKKATEVKVCFVAGCAIVAKAKNK